MWFSMEGTGYRPLNGGYVLFCTLVSALLICALYRLYLHPLSRYPGPLLARLSAWPNWYHAVKGDRHIWLYELHENHGSAVRFTPSSVSFNTFSALDAVYGNPKANVIKSDWYQTVRDTAGGFESTFTARDKARHSIKRRLLSQAFSERALRGYGLKVASQVSTWIGCLRQAASDTEGVIDIGEWANYLVFDILSDVCFGTSFNSMTSEKSRFVTKLVPSAAGGWYTLGYHPFTRLIRFLTYRASLGPYIGGTAYHDNRKFRDFCITAFKQRRLAETSKTGSDNNHRDIFHHLLNGKDPQTGQGYTTGDLACETVLLMVAGSHTTSVAIAATIHYLASSPVTLAKLRQELISASSSLHDLIETRIDHDKLNALPYLRACIDEALRLTPPNPSHLPRLVTNHGISIDGEWLPPGVTVGTCAYAMNRNPINFSRPSSYIPERWLETRAAGPTPRTSAFSTGPTGCIGKQLAYMEMLQAIASLVLVSDFTLNSRGAASEEYVITDKFVGEGEGPYLHVTPRD